MDIVNHIVLFIGWVSVVSSVVSVGVGLYFRAKIQAIIQMAKLFLK